MIMKQLTLKDIYLFAQKLIEKGEDLSKYPVYLGDDDELNGIHNGWYIDTLDAQSEDGRSFIELIEEDRGTTNLKDKGILIS